MMCVRQNGRSGGRGNWFQGAGSAMNRFIFKRESWCMSAASQGRKGRKGQKGGGIPPWWCMTVRGFTAVRREPRFSLSACEPDAEDGDGHADEGEAGEGLAKDGPGHEGGDGGDGVEEAGDVDGGAAADEVVEEADGADGEDEGDPAQGEDELAAPLDLHGLGGDGEDGGDEEAGGVLNDGAGAEIEGRTVPLLPQGADGDADQGGDGGQRHDEGEAAAGFVCDHEDGAEEAEREAGPLTGQDVLAQDDTGEGGGEEGLEGDNQAQDAGGKAEAEGPDAAAEVEGVDHEAGEGDVGELCFSFGPGCAGEEGDGDQDGEDDAVAQREEGEGLGVGDAELGTDEAAAPKEDEEPWDDGGPAGGG